MLLRLLLAAPWLAVAFLACGSSSGTPTKTPPADAGADGSIPPADGPFACGTSTCAADQYCVQPCDCGGEAACNAPLDGGGCAPGQVMQGSCCIVPCTEPPPSCVDTPQCGDPTP
ncbi:MAG TPA: hypothetical protein VIY73_11995, partial [Polyangiaceae bacterium]